MVKETVKEIQAVDVPTQTERRIQLPNEEVVDFVDYLVWLGNKIVKLERSVG